MKRTSLALACALAWACALTASAQTAPATNPAKAQGQETRATAGGKAAGKERARLAKAENAKCRENLKPRQEKQKKAAAT
jgi:hypothetical protein